MRKIEWKPKRSNEFVRARVGCIVLRCFSYSISNSKNRWRSDASIREIAATMRRGPLRYSLSKAKEDAVQMAHELLLDYHAVVTTAMKNFDLLE